MAIAVDSAPDVSLSSPAAGASFTAPASIPLAASVADATGAIARVDFYQGATLITSLSAAPYSFTWTGVPAGSYSLTAVAVNDAGQSTTSAAVAITVKAGGAQMYFIHPDHLNTPRLILDQAGNTVWRNDNTEPFGDSVANSDPGGTGNVFEFNLRFPGQYFDRETGLAYNLFRDYSAGIGRYVQSDLVGLSAGLNTYVYVAANVLSRKDPEGLYEVNPHDYFNGGGGGGGGGSSGFSGTYLQNYIVPGQTPSGTITNSDMVAAGVILAGSAFAGAAAAEVSTFAIDNWILFNKIRTIASMCIRMMKPLDPNSPELPPPPPVRVPPAVRTTPSSSPPQPRPMKP